MVFSDLFFLFVFLPLFALLYLLAARRDRHDSVLLDSPQQAYKNHVLIIFSLIFYAWGEPVYVFLMLGCVVFNYLVGIIIDRSPILPPSVRSSMPTSSRIPSMRGAFPWPLPA